MPATPLAARGIPLLAGGRAATAAVLRDAIEVQQRRRGPARRRPRLSSARPNDAVVRTSAAHLRVMVDDTGIFQHADGGVPALEHGYCVDDVARFVPLGYELSTTDPSWTPDVVRSLGFLRSASDGQTAAMRNFLSWDRKWLDEPHDGDHVGRTMWGLGELLSAGCGPALAVRRSRCCAGWPAGSRRPIPRFAPRCTAPSDSLRGVPHVPLP